MRGEDKLFPAEFSDLKQDQIVQVTLVRKKGVPPRRPTRKGKDVDPDLLADYLPQMAKIASGWVQSAFRSDHPTFSASAVGRSPPAQPMTTFPSNSGCRWAGGG